MFTGKRHPPCLLGTGIRHVYWEQGWTRADPQPSKSLSYKESTINIQKSTVALKCTVALKTPTTPSQLTGQAAWSLHTYSYELQRWSCWQASQKMPGQAKWNHETGPEGQQSNWSGLPVGHCHLAPQWSVEQHLPPLPREHLSYVAADPVVVPASFGFNWHFFFFFTHLLIKWPSALMCAAAVVI